MHYIRKHLDSFKLFIYLYENIFILIMFAYTFSGITNTKMDTSN